jgi:hypothetical protein
MIKVGERELIFSATVITQDECDVTCTFPINEVQTTVILCFHPSPEGGKEQPSVEAKVIGQNQLRIGLRGWSNAIGTATKEPVKIGQTSDGRGIGILLYSQRVGDINRLDFQVVLGGSYE